VGALRTLLVEAAAEKAAKAELIRAADHLGVRTQREQWWLPEFR
jgi:hypothetical protein